MPTIAFSTTRSACLASSSPSARERRPPGKPEWRCRNLFWSLSPLMATLSALMTMTKSPPSTFGVNVGLCLPRSSLAASTASRPSTTSVASRTYHERVVSPAFGVYVGTARTFSSSRVGPGDPGAGQVWAADCLGDRRRPEVPASQRTPTWQLTCGRHRRSKRAFRHELARIEGDPCEFASFRRQVGSEEPEGLVAIAHQQVLGLLVVVEHHLVVLPPDAGLLVPTERGMRGVLVVAVRPHPAGLHVATCPVGGVAVTAPHPGTQAVQGVVGDADRVVVVLERRHRHHRSEDGLLEHPHLVITLEDGGLHVEAAAQVTAQVG